MQMPRITLVDPGYRGGDEREGVVVVVGEQTPVGAKEASGQILRERPRHTNQRQDTANGAAGLVACDEKWGSKTVSLFGYGLPTEQVIKRGIRPPRDVSVPGTRILQCGYVYVRSGGGSSAYRDVACTYSHGPGRCTRAASPRIGCCSSATRDWNA